MTAVDQCFTTEQPCAAQRWPRRSSRTLRVIVGGLALLSLVGCGSDESGPGETTPAGPWPTTPTETPAAAAEAATPADPRIADAERLGALAVRIEFDPARSDTLLQAEGLDRAAFESKLYDFALDSDLANAYERGRMDTRRALKAAAATQSTPAP